MVVGESVVSQIKFFYFRRKKKKKKQRETEGSC